MVSLIVGIVIVLGFIVLGAAIVLLRSLLRRQDNSPAMDEARMVQDMYRTLERLEKRMEVLELLLAEHSDEARKGGNDDAARRF